MDQKKAIIIASIAAVLIGAAVFAVILIRSRSFGEETVLPPPDETTDSTDGGVLVINETDPSTSATSGSPTFPPDLALPPLTTIDATATDEGCDITDDEIDCDYDHLTNAEERQYKTDPLNEDTDGDVVGDGSEVKTWMTDPLNPRSVDPTMTDFEAIKAGKKNPR